MLIFEEVSKKFGRKKVLDSLDLKISPGEFVSIIGPSGAGKSTLVNLLIGAERLSMGVITVDGFRVTEMNNKELQYYRRRIGVVFQDYKLLPQKTVEENIEFALEVCGYEDAEIGKRTAEVLKKVGMFGHRRKFPRQLSGGERQRCAIARALVHHPRMIIADEPTGNLDPKNADEIVKLLLQLNAEGITVILTTHNKEIVNGLKRRVIKLDEGKLIWDRGVGVYE